MVVGMSRGIQETRLGHILSGLSRIWARCGRVGG